MQKNLFVVIIVALILSSCASLNTSNYEDSALYASSGSSTQVTRQSPAEFESMMNETVKPAIWTLHNGTLRDPIPIGEYGEWDIYHENRLLNERTDYTIRMNVNYAVRGDQVLNLYNAYSKEMADIEAASSRYYYNDYEKYIPKPGNELILINISMEVDSDENTPLPLNPHDFNIASSSGVRFSNGKDYDWDTFEYLNLIDYSVYPGGKATGNLIYEVPENQDILLEFVGVWFKTM